MNEDLEGNESEIRWKEENVMRGGRNVKHREREKVLEIVQFSSE
ncbi:hypothetical protein MHK_010376, partial [Candidatus Magnetomorum sp. HK-1]